MLRLTIAVLVTVGCCLSLPLCWPVVISHFSRESFRWTLLSHDHGSSALAVVVAAAVTVAVAAVRLLAVSPPATAEVPHPSACLPVSTSLIIR